MDEPVQLLNKLKKKNNLTKKFIALQHGETIKI